MKVKNIIKILHFIHKYQIIYLKNYSLKLYRHYNTNYKYIWYKN